MPVFDPNAVHTWTDDDLDVDDNGRLRGQDTGAPSGEDWSPEALGADLERTHPVGRGGTADVVAATQQTLRRRVAVKALRSDRDSPAARAALVREAKVLAQLDHPGVAAVHFLTPDTEGRPEIVMKLVDGLPWTQLIEDPAQFPQLGRHQDPLEEHLRILRRVCEALQYAHEAGILHRDVKPDNVMVGRHGQVWLMDWGMAVAYAAPADAWLRSVKRIRQVAGTPGYLAPEMALGQGDQIGPHSDIYLVGATLHQVLTGKKRHEGADVVEKLEAAVSSADHDYDDDVPPGLGQIANMCCALEASERYSSAAELLSVLREYQEERGARRLASDAQELGEELLGEVARVGYAQADPEALDEVRFAYAQARRLSPDNAELLDNLQAFLLTMMQAALDAEDIDVAGRCLLAMPRPNPDLARRLDQLRKERDERSAEFQMLRDLHDVSSPGELRQSYFAGVAISSALWFAAIEVGTHFGWWPNTHGTLILAFALITLAFGVVGARLIPGEALSHGNTLLRRALMVRVGGAVPFFALAWLVGASITATLGLHLFLQGAHILVVTVLLGRLGEAARPSYGAALFYLVTAAAIPLAPSVPFLMYGIGTAGGQFLLGHRDRMMRLQGNEGR